MVFFRITGESADIHTIIFHFGIMITVNQITVAVQQRFSSFLVGGDSSSPAGSEE